MSHNNPELNAFFYSNKSARVLATRVKRFIQRNTNLIWSRLLSFSFSSASLFIGFLFRLSLKNCRYKHKAKSGIYPCNNQQFYGLNAQVDVLFASHPILHRRYPSLMQYVFLSKFNFREMTVNTRIV